MCVCVSVFLNRMQVQRLLGTMQLLAPNRCQAGARSSLKYAINWRKREEYEGGKVLESCVNNEGAKEFYKSSENQRLVRPAGEAYNAMDVTCGAGRRILRKLAPVLGLYCTTLPPCPNIL